jgi:hypothetical protein
VSGPTESSPPLLLVKGDATAEEIAALTVVLQAVAGSAGDAPAKPRSEWAAHHRKMCPVLPSGPGGWRSSTLPR